MSADVSTAATAPGTTPTATPRAAATWRQIAAQTRMELRLLTRNGESLLVTLGIPLGILVFFSTVDVLPTGDTEPVTFLVPGVLAISVMSTGLVAVAIQTGFERKYAVLKRIGATPLRRSAYLASKALAVTLITAVQTVLVLVIAAVGLDWNASASVLAVLVAIVLGVFAFTSMGLLMAGALRAEATLALANAVYLLLMLLSGVAFEADALPGPLEAVASLLPSGALAEALRAAVDAGDGAWDVGALAVVAAWGVAAAGLAARSFRWEP